MKENILLDEFKLNKFFTLKNRIVLAPMTRVHASDDLVPTQAMANYYARRTEAGLIVTEGTAISPDALGHKNVPDIFNNTQIDHWKHVTDQVHNQNGLIFMQLWHVGRVSHPIFLKGELPVSASETLMTGKVSRTSNLTHGKARAAGPEEIRRLIQSYSDAAKNAIRAGFDGVEIHGANGYLIDQFLHYHTNQRDDEYGGTPENMSRFALQIIQACGEMIGYEHVGIRLSPGAYLNEIIGDDRDALVFQFLLSQLNHYPIAYVHTGNFNDSRKFSELNNLTMSAFIRSYYSGTLIGCGSYTVEMAENAILKKEIDLVAFGRSFIANPDLVHAIRNRSVMQTYNANMLTTLY